MFRHPPGPFQARSDNRDLSDAQNGPRARPVRSVSALQPRAGQEPPGQRRVEACPTDPQGTGRYTSVAIEVYPSEGTRTETYRRTVGMSRALYSARPVPDSAHPVEERDVAIVRNSPSLVWWVSAWRPTLETQSTAGSSALATLYLPSSLNAPRSIPRRASALP